MNLQTGKPVHEGRYVVYVPGLLGWLEPQIVTWTKGAWRHYHSTQEYPDEVICWAGPLPVLNRPTVGVDIPAPRATITEYDL